jgi:hypothetical protein
MLLFTTKPYHSPLVSSHLFNISGDELDDFSNSTQSGASRSTKRGPPRSPTFTPTSKPPLPPSPHNGNGEDSIASSRTGSFDIPSSMLPPEPPRHSYSGDVSANRAADDMSGMMEYLHTSAVLRGGDASMTSGMEHANSLGNGHGGGVSNGVITPATGLDAEFLASPIMAHKSFQSPHHGNIVDDTSIASIRERSELW